MSAVVALLGASPVDLGTIGGSGAAVISFLLVIGMRLVDRYLPEGRSDGRVPRQRRSRPVEDYDDYDDAGA